eukprot:CAMPEP_0204312860 /NCGR_PEP_ID=MMETSP0469-20131031/3235_1 /ASSEMBLY_ACC=CAM_ASM_000384 /TAXON_ID=2969 /ORGANISM="Oxyrrhis marina" /LENGTH=172 /DNA_ID=CAMNT_0051293053 /DNA_START=1 /DNA_END=516 /DNA_ORIENTATION=-
MGFVAAVPTIAAATATVQYGVCTQEYIDNAYVLEGLIPVGLCSILANEMSRYLQTYYRAPRYGSVPTPGGILVLQPIVLVASVVGLILTLRSDDLVPITDRVPAVVFATLGSASCFVLVAVIEVNRGRLTEYRADEEEDAASVLLSGNCVASVVQSGEGERPGMEQGWEAGK